MAFAYWAIVIGFLLTTVAIVNSRVQRWPLSAAMLYLAMGWAIGPNGLGLLTPDLYRHTTLLEHVTEIALLLSLFSSGLKLGVPLGDWRWLLPLRLATLGMLWTVLFATAIAMLWLQLSFAAAFLLAAILAPTDPVLAADVQVADSNDRDRLRFSLTGEGGLNDGIAVPFMILAFHLYSNADPQQWFWHWLGADILWSMTIGVLIGGLLGKIIGTLVIHLRVHQQEAIGLDEFLALGLIGLSYGVATLAHSSGFLAVFAAGLMLRHSRGEPDAKSLTTFLEGETRSREAAQKLATHPTHAGTFMMRAVRGFNEQLEHIGEVAVVLIVGALLASITLDAKALAFVALLFFVARPLAVRISLFRAAIADDQHLLISWFGIRGIGSIYYLLLAINERLSEPQLNTLINLVLLTVVCSIVAHGISVTPLMSIYAGRRRHR